MSESCFAYLLQSQLSFQEMSYCVSDCRVKWVFADAIICRQIPGLAVDRINHWLIIWTPDMVREEDDRKYLQRLITFHSNTGFIWNATKIVVRLRPETRHSLNKRDQMEMRQDLRTGVTNDGHHCEPKRDLYCKSGAEYAFALWLCLWLCLICNIF